MSSQTTGSANEKIPCGREGMHPRSYMSEQKKANAAKDERSMQHPPVKTDKYKG